MLGMNLKSWRLVCSPKSNVGLSITTLLFAGLDRMYKHATKQCPHDFSCITDCWCMCSLRCFTILHLAEILFLYLWLMSRFFYFGAWEFVRFSFLRKTRALRIGGYEFEFWILSWKLHNFDSLKIKTGTRVKTILNGS